jgi:hypothetical protein
MKVYVHTVFLSLRRKKTPSLLFMLRKEELLCLIKTSTLRKTSMLRKR